MALFLSVRRPRELQAELIEGGYAADAPCAVVYRATWPDEVVLRCPLGELARPIRGAKITTQALVIVGPALDDDGDRRRARTSTTPATAIATARWAAPIDTARRRGHGAT